jgi:hypothetical protein
MFDNMPMSDSRTAQVLREDRGAKASGPPLEKRPVLQQFANLNENLTALGVTLNNLESRLSPVLEAPSPEAQDNSQSQQPNTIAEALLGANQRLNALRSQVIKIIERLQI